ncbi:MAG TPA: protein translocase subunit SecD [Candidatus Angelobacter sp.]|nr:protein translocase subunit SecD [Candidatus Angelobacter sp.]
MQKKTGLKLAISFGVMVLFLALIFLGNDWERSFQAIKERGLVGGLQESIHLGLDLKGGAHFILQVKVNEAVSTDSDRAVELLKEELQKSNAKFTDISKPDAQHPERILITGLATDALGKVRDLVDSRLPEYELTSGVNNGYVVSMKAAALSNLKTRTVTQSIEAIRNRVDTLGVREPVIQEHGLGDYQILVQLPGADDTARVKEIISSTARLEIRQAFVGSEGYANEADALAAHGGVLPPNQVILPGKNIGSSGESQDRVWVVARVPVVGGTDIKDAVPSKDEVNKPSVVFHLTAAAGNKFATFTADHSERTSDPYHYLAIVLDEHVREVASIRDEIHDTGTISGGFTDQSAKDLSMLLSSGSLPASISYLEERSVGPSLGIDSIRAGVRAAVIGMIAVMLFMLVYYRGAGINANVALILNLIILLGFLGFSGATLTLPGIAGVILTVGMGVDSNVLIFERIREELRNGKAPAAAVDQGFGRAWLTIIDTHVTTIVSAAILIVFGTGPVRGFAVTLIFGLLANLFTAVFVSRAIFDAVLQRKQRGEALSI